MSGNRSPEDNHHQGQWWAQLAEDQGASVSECGRGYRVSTPRGTVEFPNREMRPGENRSLRKLFRLLRIITVLVLLGIFACRLSGGF